jgi:8-oxo-dGTP pyrophosphatase MutT (NUDIX family)
MSNVMDATFRERLLKALAMELPYTERRRVQGSRPSAVLILFGAFREKPSELAALVTRRTNSVSSHKGQMAFPGGMSEPDETAAGQLGAIQTALRETEEEIGIAQTDVEVLGALPSLSTITDYEVTPVVAVLNKPIEECPLKLNPDEIAEAIWVPLATLLEPQTYRTEYMRAGAINYPIHVYQVREHRIWGATGSMIKNLLDRLQALG